MRAKKRKDNLIEIKVSLGYDSLGHQIRKSVYGHTQAEARRLADEIKDKQRLGLRTSDMTVYAYAHAWYDLNAPDRRMNTNLMYENIIDKHLQYERLGRLPLDKATVSDVQEFINTQKEHYETASKMRMTMSQVFRFAVTDGLILRSPVTGIKIPAKPCSKKRALTDTEKAAVRDAKLDPEERAYLDVLFYLGLRREEALALMGSDFDFTFCSVSISRAVNFDQSGKGILADTKNNTSVRTVQLPSECIQRMKTYVGSLSGLYLFPAAKSGGFKSKSSYIRFWSRIVKKLSDAAGEDIDLTAHIFRHNYATMLYYSGISIKMAASLLGHKDTKMIMQVYAHLDDLKENTKFKLDQMVRIG